LTFPFYKQHDGKDCGPTCLKIISKYYGKLISIEKLRELCETTREGSSLLALSNAAETLGFKTLGARLTLERLEDVALPCILHWNKNHYVVLYDIRSSKSVFNKNKIIYKISDPAYGLIDYERNDFLKFWIGNNATELSQEGIVLLLEPSITFTTDTVEHVHAVSKYGFSILYSYLIRYKFYIIQLITGLIVASLLQLFATFLTQNIVDVCIRNQNINFLYVILLSQLGVFFGRTILEFIKSWTLLHLSARINMSMISDFFIKLMKLPISFFDVRVTGDIMQRISDHHRIERILTTSSLSVLFSVLNMIIMSSVLAYYNLQIFFVFFIGSTFYFLWTILFLKQREILDYKRFLEVAQEQNNIIEMINGMQEIKLHNAEKQKRWNWEYIQARLFKISITGLAIEQIQNIGSNTINELKNMIIVYISAKLVINGQITLGVMMAISSIVGSLNGPIHQLIGFIRELQDAKISISRLSEIHEKKDEIQLEVNQSSIVPANEDIYIENLSYRYFGTSRFVIKDLNLIIPTNKITAIVGSSGSGKTTLMKLLLKFYEPDSGQIKIGKTNLNHIKSNAWREHVGTVMQEGYIFSDTIANNIAIGSNKIDIKKLRYATEVSCIKEFIEDYPLQYNTKVGNEGIGMSTGQKQRLLIARAVYKNPEVLFFDEATSALDANNEKKIMKNLNEFFKNKTVVVIAHRLSTVVNADQIVVLENGGIVELGTHNDLINIRGKYFDLVKNQLHI